MKSDISLTQISSAISTFFKRYHITLFIVLALGGVIAATLTISSIAQTSGASGATSSPQAVFNQQTIDRLDSLKTVDEQSPNPDVPMGKRDPFFE